MGHNLLLSLFIWMLKISQLWPVKVISIWLVSFWHAHIILWVLPEFLWKVLPFSKPWQKSALLRGSLVSFDWPWCLDTKIQVLRSGCPSQLIWALTPCTDHHGPPPPPPTTLQWILLGPTRWLQTTLLGGRTEEEEKLIYFFALEFSRL